jgi:hypothetical protein
LAPQIRTRKRKPIAGSLDARIVAQIITIDGIFIAASDLKNTLLHKIQKRVIDIAWVTTISQSIYHSGDQSHLRLKGAKQQNSTITRDGATGKISLNYLARNACEW